MRSIYLPNVDKLKMVLKNRIKAAGRAAFFHFLGSVLVACLAAVLVLLLWYPYPYGELSGGRKLFLLLIAVDVVCGPLLTLVLFNPKKSRNEFFVDMSLVVLIQLIALIYGLHTAHQARPLFLVHEVDRFRVVGMPDYGNVDVSNEILNLPQSLRPSFFSSPILVGIRDAVNKKERREIMIESVFGGRDYSQRPEFYTIYDASYAAKVINRSRSLSAFVNHFPLVRSEALNILRAENVDLYDARYLPVLHKQEWIAVLSPNGRIIGFLPGDGFAVE